MNKQIRELAEQAGLGHERWNTTSQFESFLEKFAELIVKKCMMQCGAVHEASEYVRGKNDAFGLGAEKCKVLIKEHFGVEE